MMRGKKRGKENIYVDGKPSSGSSVHDGGTRSGQTRKISFMVLFLIRMIRSVKTKRMRGTKGKIEPTGRIQMRIVYFGFSA